MTASTSVHSNAFNFLSFVQSGVDPRTGLYTVGLALDEVLSNDLRGPAVPLALSYNPLNTLDSGYGLGWDLALTQYTPSNQVVSLHSGERFKVTGRDPGNPARMLMKEQKIEGFQLYDISGDPRGDYKVVHKSGEVEILKLMGATPQVAMPVKLYSPQGHGVSLAYRADGGDGRMLGSVSDSQGTLLEVVPDTAAKTLEIRLKPVNGVASAVFVLHLSGGRVTRIALPTDNAAGWRFEYETLRGLLCIKDVWTPLGGHETLQYLDEGHGFPGSSGHQNIPRVTDHVLDPGAGQPPIIVKYSYSSNNFLGYNAPITWTDDGLDNLYKVIGAYTYESTESLMVNDIAVRSVNRRFNRFHLLTAQTTTRGTHRQTVTTTYYANDTDTFDNQVRQCQLPKQAVTRWELTDDPRQWREDHVLSEYDIYGNLTRSVQANGIAETTQYYPAEGVPGDCPPDPYGFVRHKRESTVTPSADPDKVADLQGDAPTLSTRYRYVIQQPLTGGDAPWVALAEEQLLDISGGAGQVLECSVYRLYDEPDNPLIHGLREQEALTLGTAPGRTLFTDYTYSKPAATYATFAGETVLRTQQVLSTDFDAVSQRITEERSLLNGEPLLARDQDVDIRYTYDALGRVLSETVAPDTPNAATRTYRYGLVRPAGPGEPPPGELASQTLENVKQERTRTWFDGLNRAVREARHDVDNAEGNPAMYRDIYAARYDVLGQLTEETEIDWLEKADLTLTSQFTYDLWGQQASVTGPDGVTRHTHDNPVTFTREEWSEGMGKTITLSNRFEKPVTVERLDLDGESRLSLHRYRYDGLGRTTYEQNAADYETLYTYDVYDRLIETGLPDGSSVVREYAGHSREDLPTLISVNGIELGTQAFDGLDRRIESTTGGRTTTYVYDTSQQQPDRVIQPDGSVIAYAYMPELTDEPVSRSVVPATSSQAPIEATYAYDPHNARLLETAEPGITLARRYNSNGEVVSETRTGADDQPREMMSVYSRQGRLLRYTDVLGQVQRYVYDNAGRLQTTALGLPGQVDAIKTDFTYTAQGQMASIDTVDVTAGQHVAVRLEYDAQGRETRRVFDLNGTLSTLTQYWTGVDQLERRLLTEGEGEGGPLLRDESYYYDPRGRLEEYLCEGPQSPVDPYGKTLVGQRFFFDALDNHEEVKTYFGPDPRADVNTATFEYDPQDPVQLRRINNSHADYPPVVELSYDANGNLLQDEAGRTLSYDSLGRLDSVGAPSGS